MRFGNRATKILRSTESSIRIIRNIYQGETIASSSHPRLYGSIQLYVIEEFDVREVFVLARRMSDSDRAFHALQNLPTVDF